MSRTKHHATVYLSDYVVSLQRKVLYKEPIFLLAVDIKQGANEPASISHTDSESHLESNNVDITYNTTLFTNLAKFIKPRMFSYLSSTLRQIFLEKYNSKLIKDNFRFQDIIDRYTSIAKAHLPNFKVIAFDGTPQQTLKTVDYDVLIIDFEPTSKKEAETAAVLKRTYLQSDKRVTFASSTLIINTCKANKLKLKANCVLTFSTSIINMYGLLFESTK